MKTQLMKQVHIDKIVELFKEVGIWNDGRFLELVKNYTAQQGLETEVIIKRLEIAFGDMLATRISSENAIRFRLKPLLLTKPEV